MPTIGTIFDVYLNINILLLVTIGVWAITRLAMQGMGMSFAYGLKLRLIKSLVLTCFIAPVLVVLYDVYVRQNGVATSYSLSISDLIVSQYLQGSFDMKAADLEVFLALRTRLTEDVLAADSMFALALLTALATGLTVGAIRLAVSMVKLANILSKCFEWRQFGSLHLLLSDSVTTPFSTRGLIKRYVILPTSMLENGKDLQIALGHELQHIRQRDTEWEIALEFMRPFFFWNPAFLVLKRQIERLRELSCDQQVIVRRNISVQDYCECLLRTCETGLKKRELFLGAMPRVAFVQLDKSPIGSNSAKFLHHRLVSLLEGEKHQRHALTLLAFMVPVLSLVGLASILMQKPNDWSHERIMFSTVLNLDRLAERSQR
ncbi:M56 family metallopeptidase [Cohaesibacter gelatinilyticus]|uniref:Signal transducer regulating beta-lactamase production, contains metallopeptidase domain n=1 Tax=Cohaesibacter gelatinilyticus TaxID=372072 RepID=A0A285NBM2_9HYPH|nr:M56 family metallopeptidase [Cohaesibacter gelatinilyticus]SNZ06830.1 Signal transducer regulating beta-lactamase production, contains metallopeptidase domain [Cohaesibacter gelatinilyticus]